ncbi:DUF4105 domain-containing protein [uncultured Neisseria sp.]|uniref:lipoprotein N-acyltransferase Lnb domain-containing protein n=1 Tax=uncultured Neisseria sp. TaxID=237778 RepID=UPI0025CD67B2|nr:DUF4105 domain-containing protein [uncultured Neisseria sp.]
MGKTLQSKSGKTLFFVKATQTTTQSDNSIKEILVANETVELLISDSRIISNGSQFGHVAIDIDGIVYGRAVPAWDVDNKIHYLYRQQVKMNRDTWGYTLRVTKKEKETILATILKLKAENATYRLSDNSCSSAMVRAFGETDILVVDPRWSFGGVLSPSDMMDALNKSSRVIKRTTYPKKK